jgi:hypothetical protein
VAPGAGPDDLRLRRPHRRPAVSSRGNR